MTQPILPSKYPWRQAHHNEVRAMLGLAETAKLPREGMAPRVIHGITVWVTPLMGPAVPPRRGRYGRRLERKSSRHRVLAECPACGRVLSAGRLHQHKCKACPTCGQIGTHTIYDPCGY